MPCKLKINCFVSTRYKSPLKGHLRKQLVKYAQKFPKPNRQVHMQFSGTAAVIS